MSFSEAMDDTDWELLAEIFSMLSTFESEHKWDLSDGERGMLAKSIFGSVKVGRSHDETFEHAFRTCWGADHTCAPRSDKEKAIMGNFLAFAVKEPK